MQLGGLKVSVVDKEEEMVVVVPKKFLVFPIRP